MGLRRREERLGKTLYEENLHLIAFLLRYGPKSVDELMRRPKRFLVDLADAIGEIMKEEKTGWEQGLMTGDS